MWKQIDNNNYFKNYLKELIIKGCYYSTEDCVSEEFCNIGYWWKMFNIMELTPSNRPPAMMLHSIAQHSMEPEGPLPGSQEPIYRPLSRAGSLQPTPPNPTFQRSILILSTHLHLCLPSSVFPSGFSTNNLHAFLFSPFHDICPTHRISLIILIILGNWYKSWSFHYMSPWSRYAPWPLYSNTLISSCLDGRDEVSHLYRTTGEIIVLYILIFTLLDSKQEDRKLCIEW
jgi:hypothetical protein